jgi:hypothetical protein
MPRTVSESVFHWRADGTWWIAPETREVPTYDEEVVARTAELRREYPGGQFPSPHAEHESGECVECDALRALDDE